MATILLPVLSTASRETSLQKENKMLDPAGGQRRDLVIKPHRSFSLLKNVPDWLPPQIAIDEWWKHNGLDHIEARINREIEYAKQKNAAD